MQLDPIRLRLIQLPQCPAAMSPPRKPSAARTQRQAKPSRWNTATLFAIPCFAVLYAAVSILWKPPLWLGGVYLGLSLITFAVYALDKSAAERGQWRTPEKMLHLLALAGGWPGALLAQQFLRHKSVKPAFRVVFWLTVGVNVMAFIGVFSPLSVSFL